MKDFKDIEFWHRVRLPDGTYTPGKCHHGPDGGDWPTTRFGMPEDLTDLIVLDIGAWDGFFSFEAERRDAGAVYATNPLPPKGPSLDGLHYLAKALESWVSVGYMDIETVDVEGDEWGGFKADLVLCYGVLYHLRNPLGAMENLYKLTADGGILLLETAMNMEVTDSETPILEYHPNFANDKTNFFYPNNAWVFEAARAVGFRKIELIYSQDNRNTYRLTKGEE